MTIKFKDNNNIGPVAINKCVFEKDPSFTENFITKPAIIT